MEFCYFESHTLDTLKNFTERDKGKIDFDNRKILYSRLSFLTPRQAADERLWAGLCHGTFYGYVRRRWSCDKGIAPSADTDKIITGIRNRLFFSGGARQCLVTNTLSKYCRARQSSSTRPQKLFRVLKSSASAR